MSFRFGSPLLDISLFVVVVQWEGAVLLLESCLCSLSTWFAAVRVSIALCAHSRRSSHSWK